MFKSIEWKNNTLIVLDQRLLPFKEEYISLKTFDDYLYAIKEMVIRGAPLIGAVGAFGFYTGIKENIPLNKVISSLQSTRPTAVNLFASITRMNKAFNNKKDLLEESIKILEEDEYSCEQIGNNGLTLFNKPVNILTHCNTGKLATCGIGTALGVIYKLHEKDFIKNVWVDETRPRLQGARLTAWELKKSNVPFTLITDNMAGWLMKNKQIDAIIIGADRIAKNGDTANKIGSYSLSVLAKHHNIPFYIAAPYTTFDNNIKNGEKIPIEERKKDEITSPYNIPITQDYPVYNPSFDIVPREHITNYITDKGIK